MIKTIIKIKDKWKVVLFINIDYNKYDIIVSELLKIKAPIHIIDDIYNKIGFEYDSGFTYSNPNFTTSVVGINKQTSREELIDTIIHEINHVQTDICDYYGIKLNSEEAAYLIGYLAKSFYIECSECFCDY